MPVAWILKTAEDRTILLLAIGRQWRGLMLTVIIIVSIIAKANISRTRSDRF
jgi:hypothetical protein